MSRTNNNANDDPDNQANGLSHIQNEGGDRSSGEKDLSNMDSQKDSSQMVR